MNWQLLSDQPHISVNRLLIKVIAKGVNGVQWMQNVRTKAADGGEVQREEGEGGGSIA